MAKGRDPRDRKRIRCCDPLQRHPKKVIRSGCRKVIQKWQALHTDLNLHEDSYVCVNCRKALCKRAPPADADEPERSGRQSPVPGPSESNAARSETCGSDDETASDEDAAVQDLDVDALDVSAHALGETPIKRKRLRKSKSTGAPNL